MNQRNKFTKLLPDSGSMYEVGGGWCGLHLMTFCVIPELSVGGSVEAEAEQSCAHLTSLSCVWLGNGAIPEAKGI